MDIKDALNDEIFITKLYLQDNFKNTQTVPTFKVTAPNGHSALFRHNISENSKDMVMWQECGCTIDRIMETREVRGCNIDGVQLTQTDERVLQYTTQGKASATEKYMKVKAAFGDMSPKICIIGHDCHPYKPQKRVNNCHTGTILDEKFQE